MSARVQGLILGLGNAKQADIATASASFLRFKKIDTTLTSPHPVTENDAAEIGKGNEFISGVYPVSYDVANRIEKFASAEFVAWAWAYALGNPVQSGASPNCATFDGGWSALAAGLTAYVKVPFVCTLAAWSILVDAGTCTIKVWKVASGPAIPAAGDSISTAGVSISAGTAVRSTTLTDFTTTAFAAGDIVGIHLQAVTGVTQAVLELEFTL